MSVGRRSARRSGPTFVLRRKRRFLVLSPPLRCFARNPSRSATAHAAPTANDPLPTTTCGASRRSRKAGLERVVQRGAVQILADENEGVLARILAPFAVEFGV